MALKFCESLFLWINNFIVFWRIKVFTTDASCLVCSLKINLCDHWHASSNTSALKKERKAENKLSVMDLFQKYHNTLCCPSKISQKHCFQFLLGQIIHYCWFAHNVTAFVFGHVGGKWTHIFMSILREKNSFVLTPNMAVMWLHSKNWTGWIYLSKSCLFLLISISKSIYIFAKCHLSYRRS